MAASLAHQSAAQVAPTLPSSFRGFLRETRADMLGFLTRWAQLGGVVRIRTRLFVSHLITAPSAVQHVLQDNHRNYIKEVRSARIFRLALGEGLFLSEGESWRAQRRVANPAFHRERLAAMAAAMTDAIGTMLERWDEFAARGEPFDLSAEMMRLTVDVVGRALVGDDLCPDADTLGRAMLYTFEYFSYRLNHLLAPPLFIPTGRNRRFRQAGREMDRVVDRVIEHGRMRGGGNGDLLSMLLAASDSSGNGGPARKELRSNIATFLGAGTETTAVALCWIWYLLSKHPEAERRLRHEVGAVLGERAPTFDDLPKLVYTRCVIDEALRLYPPAWIVSRTAIADDVVEGFAIPARSSVFVSPWVTHRSLLYWENPEQFDPERFSPERSAGRHGYAYYPFGGGPRACIGDRFSMMEQTLALAMVTQKFRVQVVEDHPIVPDPVFTLRPKGGIRATVRRDCP